MSWNMTLKMWITNFSRLSSGRWSASGPRWESDRRVLPAAQSAAGSQYGLASCQRRRHHQAAGQTPAQAAVWESVVPPRPRLPRAAGGLHQVMTPEAVLTEVLSLSCRLFVCHHLMCVSVHTCAGVQALRRWITCVVSIWESVLLRRARPAPG